MKSWMTLKLGISLLVLFTALQLAGCAQSERANQVYAKIERAPGEPTIRIRVAQNVQECVVGGPAKLLVTPLAGTGIRATSSGTASLDDRILQSPVIIRRDGSTVLALDQSGKRITGESGVQIVGVGSELLTVDGVDAPGTVWIHATDRGGIDAVEHVAMEAYLPGVLEKELPGGWEEAAYKAQAIAARSFALHERRRKVSMGSHFDVESTTVSQVYGGAVVESWSHNAVRSTKGMVLKHNNQLVRAYFSSTTGGRSASAMDIWGAGGDGRLAFNASPALQVSTGTTNRRTRPDGSGWDSGSPRYRWTADRLVGPLSDRIRAYGQQHGFSIARMGRITSIDVSERNPVGRPVRFEVTDDAGKVWRMPAEHMRWAMGAGPNVQGGSVWSSDFDARIQGNTVMITGRGWGHGVGLCQWSAQGMANAGWNANEILSVFYTNAEVKREW